VGIMAQILSTNIPVRQSWEEAGCTVGVRADGAEPFPRGRHHAAGIMRRCPLTLYRMLPHL
jgi:hypothetical protein